MKKQSKKNPDEIVKAFSVSISDACLVEFQDHGEIETASGSLSKVTAVFKAERGKGHPLEVTFLGKVADSFLNDEPEVYDVLTLNLNLSSRVHDNGNGPKWFASVNCWSYDYIENLVVKPGNKGANTAAKPAQRPVPAPATPAPVGDDLPF